MIHEYVCLVCNKAQDINISTYDILTNNKVFVEVDQKKLEERIHAPRECECGGQLKHKLSASSETIMASRGNGVITRRFKY